MTYSLRSVVKGSALYTSGQVLTKASAFLLIPLYTRFLTPADYGVVGYLQFILQILSTILMFGFYGAQTRFFYQHKNEAGVVGEYLFSINFWLVCILVPGVVMTILWGERLYSVIGANDIPFHPYVPVIAWTILFQVMNQLAISYWLARKAYLKTTLLQILLFALMTGFAIFLIVGLKMGAEGKIRSMLYGQMAFFLVAYPAYARHFVFRARWAHIAFSLGFGVPIVIHLLSGVMHTAIDRAILADRVSVSELGLYTLGYQVGMVMSIVTASVNKAWQPNYYDLMASGETGRDHHVRRTYNFWLIIMSVVCTIGILWGGDILRLVVPDHFHGAVGVIPYILLGYFFHGLYFFAVAPIFFYKKTSLLPLFTSAAAGVNIGLNYLLIPHLGITGAALATTVSMLFQAIVVHLAARRLHNHGFDIGKTAMISLLMAVSFLGPLYIGDPVISQVARVGFMGLLCLVLAFWFKNEIVSVLAFAKRG